jgi:hypothetical protein
MRIGTDDSVGHESGKQIFETLGQPPRLIDHHVITAFDALSGPSFAVLNFVVSSAIATKVLGHCVVLLRNTLNGRNRWQLFEKRGKIQPTKIFPITSSAPTGMLITAIRFPTCMLVNIAIA